MPIIFCKIICYVFCRPIVVLKKMKSSQSIIFVLSICTVVLYTHVIFCVSRGCFCFLRFCRVFPKWH